MIDKHVTNLASFNKKTTGHTKDIILRQPGRLLFQDPQLSVPVSRRVWLYRGNNYYK
jgi:hypothetical protein